MKLEFHPSGDCCKNQQSQEAPRRATARSRGLVRHELAGDLLFCHKDSVIDGGGAFGTLFAFTLMRASPIGWGARQVRH